MAKHIRSVQYEGNVLAADHIYEISIVGHNGKDPTPDFFPWNPHSGEKRANCQLTVYKHPVGTAPQSGSHAESLVIPRNEKFVMRTSV